MACNIHSSDTLWLKTSYTHPKAVMDFSIVSIVSTSSLTPPQNNNQIYCRFRTNYFLHPHRHSQQSNSTCLITSFNHNSCLSSKMKFPSDLYPAITKYLISKFESSQKQKVSKNQNKLIENRNKHNISWWDIYLIYIFLETIHTLTGKLNPRDVP